MDYIVDRKDYQNYLQLFADTGWEHMGEIGGWQYFRKTAQAGQPTEIYTDNASKATKYQRLIIMLVVFLPFFIMLSTRTIDNGSPFSDLYHVAQIFWAILMILYTIAMLKILQRVRQLKGK